MGYAPIEILDYVIDNEKEADFMLAIAMHKGGYSIGEIADLKIICKEDRVIVKSDMYNITERIEDPDIVIAAKAGKYISAFMSRMNNSFQVHFLVHDCMIEDKPKYEDEIALRVVQYMILRTIKQLRLDTPKKVDSYIAK